MTKFFSVHKGKLPAIILSVLLLLLVSGCSRDNDPAQNGDSDSYVAAENVNWDLLNERAASFITAVASGDFDVAVAMFSEAMTQGVGTSGLQNAWNEIIALAGEFIEIHGIENAVHDGYFICGVIMRHTDFGFGWNVVFSEDGIIQGLFTGGTLILAEATYIPHPPTATQRNGFTDYTVVLGADTAFPLNGILSMPDNATGQVPAVVIVHGSGAHDMDGTIHGNKPYRDIADFLASQGIAVIRHDKRNFAHAARLAEEVGGKGTVWHEAIEDAILAAEKLRNHPRIDENRVFIIGHSLGGVLAPRIHANGGNFAGLVLMAASPRCILDMFIEQSTASVLSGLDDGLIDEATKTVMLAELAILSDIFGSIAYMTAEEARETPIPALGTMAYYLKDMQQHPFADYARKVAVPILVLQGGSDFQVLTDIDFVLLQEIFADHADVTVTVYEGLNHLFMPTTATNFVQHAMGITQAVGNVDTRVLQDIADWIMGVAQ
jgi:dienelactone hydrolase